MVKMRGVAEWATRLMGAQNGYPELGKFGAHHFHTFYTLTKQMQKINISKKIARELFFYDISYHSMKDTLSLGRTSTLAGK